MTVDWTSTARGTPISPLAGARFLNRALALSRHRAASVSVLFCGDRKMRDLNSRYRGKDKTTDVLSFPSANSVGAFLGDIVIAVPEVRRQAKSGGVTPEDVARKLLLHGLLHLLGYDHETDKGEMDAIEARLRRRLAVPE